MKQYKDYTPKIDGGEKTEEGVISMDPTRSGTNEHPGRSASAGRQVSRLVSGRAFRKEEAPVTVPLPTVGGMAPIPALLREADSATVPAQTATSTPCKPRCPNCSAHRLTATSPRILPSASLQALFWDA